MKQVKLLTTIDIPGAGIGLSKGLASNINKFRIIRIAPRGLSSSSIDDCYDIAIAKADATIAFFNEWEQEYNCIASKSHTHNKILYSIDSFHVDPQNITVLSNVFTSESYNTIFIAGWKESEFPGVEHQAFLFGKKILENL